MDISKTFVNSRHLQKSELQNHSANMILRQLSLEIKAGEFFSLLGPSGCGKTTLLRIIAGLETPTSGELYFEQKRIDTLTAQKRPFHMVFQRYALFPHLDVYDNVAFGLRLKKISEFEIESRVKESLKLVSMDDFIFRYPETLSGGQQQRVALARALVNRPKILLLDEPLSALDLKLREKMQAELKSIQRASGITFILVTHDQGEALALSDRIAVMNKGQMDQVGTPDEIYNNPKTHFVADFVGESSFIKENQGLRMLRPEKLSLFDSERNQASDVVYSGRITQTLFRGTEIEALILLPSEEVLRFFISTEDFKKNNLKIGNQIKLTAKIEQTSFFKDVLN